MYTRKYRMADKVVEIRSLYGDVHDYCQGYEAFGEPDFSVEITQSDIDYEKMKSDSECAYEGVPLQNFSQNVLEITAVYRKIAEQMVQYGSMVFHGSVVAVDGQGYLFTAKSGTGKSTHTRLWRELFGERAVMVNDDKPILHVADDRVTVYGTPYNGKHRLGSDISVQLKAICILQRAEENHIEPISKAEAYAMLLQQVYRPQDSKAMRDTLFYIDKMAELVSLYRLGCNMDISAAETAYNGMKG
ncbi:MAG: hypothetical protein IIZ53_06130 [Ruminococcus sp.]|nr:hypothetical protein [Ruminococcus sp.]